jgi:hypothetical protein
VATPVGRYDLRIYTGPSSVNNRPERATLKLLKYRFYVVVRRLIPQTSFATRLPVFPRKRLVC